MANNVTIGVRVKNEFGGIEEITGLIKKLTGGAIIPAAAAVAAFGIQLASAAAPVALLGAAVLPQITSIKNLSTSYDAVGTAVEQYGKKSKQAKEAQKEYNDQLKALPAATQKTAVAFQGLKNAFSKWSDSLAGNTMPIFTKGLNGLKNLLPLLTPFVKDAAKQLSDFATKIGSGIKTDKFKELVGEFQKFSSGALKGVLNAVTYLGGALKGMVLSQGFKNFIDTGKKDGPGIALMFQNLAQFIGKFIKAAGPLAGLQLKGLEVIASVLNKIPVPVLNVLAPLILGIAGAMKIWTIAQLAWDAAASANPVGAIITGLFLLAGALVYAYNHSKTFRTIVQDNFKAVSYAFLTLAKVGIEALKELGDIWLETITMIVNLGASAFGWIPGVGSKLKGAAKAVSGFGKEFDSSMNGAASHTQNLINKIFAIPKSKTFILYYKGVNEGVKGPGGSYTSSNGYSYAHGGNVGRALSTAATGGIRSNNVLVGEHGPEIVDLAPGSHVNSNPDSMRMLNSGGNNAAPVTINLSIGGTALGSITVDLLRKTIRTRGGNVQAVLGT